MLELQDPLVREDPVPCTITGSLLGITLLWIWENALSSKDHNLGSDSHSSNILVYAPMPYWRSKTKKNREFLLWINATIQYRKPTFLKHWLGKDRFKKVKPMEMGDILLFSSTYILVCSFNSVLGVFLPPWRPWRFNIWKSEILLICYPPFVHVDLWFLFKCCTIQYMACGL